MVLIKTNRGEIGLILSKKTRGKEEENEDEDDEYEVGGEKVFHEGFVTRAVRA